MSIAGRAPLEQFLDRFDEVLYFPTIPWSFSWQRAQALIRGFAEAHAGKPGYVFPPLGLLAHSPVSWTTCRRVLRAVQYRVRRSDGPAAPALPPSYAAPECLTFVRGVFVPGTGLWRRSATFAVSPTFRRLLRSGGRRLVLASYVNEIIEAFADTAEFTILDVSERRQCNPLLPPRAKENERSFAARANILVADNRATLLDYAGERAGADRPSYYIPQGFTPSGRRRLRAASANAPLAYLGNLHHAIDLDWLRRLADSNPERRIRLCGKVLSPATARLLTLPNVEYWGEIPHHDIARFLDGVCWGLIPYKLDDWTSGVFPTKLLEYLDCGVPVLSTALPEVAQFGHLPFVRVLSDPSSLPPPPSMDGLEAFLSEHTWEARLSAYGRALLESMR